MSENMAGSKEFLFAPRDAFNALVAKKGVPAIFVSGL